MEKQTTSDSKPTKNNKKTKITFIIILFIIIAVIDFFLIYNNIKKYKQQKYIDTREEMMKVPSGLHMLITEETYDETFGENYQDKKTIFYFVIDENDICQTCFAEYINIEIEPYPGGSFINPTKIDNTTYTELLAYNGIPLEDIKKLFEIPPHRQIIAEW